MDGFGCEILVLIAMSGGACSGGGGGGEFAEGEGKEESSMEGHNSDSIVRGVGAGVILKWVMDGVKIHGNRGFSLGLP